MRSIFITSFHPLISRNILQTKILDYLRSEISVYILCPDYKLDFFERNFSRDNVKIIEVAIEPLRAGERFWKELGNSLLRTSTIQGNRRERYLKDKKKFSYFFFLLCHQTIARLKFVTKLYQKLSPFFFCSGRYIALFKKYSPDLVFATDIFHDEDVRMLASAEHANIKTAGMVRSWDNCTNKGILPVVPHYIIVHNQIIESELRSMHLVPKTGNVTPTGIPQFDYYLGYKPARPEDFYVRTGFSSERKVILFAPTGKKFVDDDWLLLQAIHDAVMTGKISGNPQILVRYPPGDVMDQDKVSFSRDVSVFTDRPGVEFDRKLQKDRELSGDDMIRLADTLYYSDMLVSVGSTLCIDIASFDKPIICPAISFEGIPSERSMTKMYKKHHYQYLMRTGGVEVPMTVGELTLSIEDSLRNPKKKARSRIRLLVEQVWKFDGNASLRIADKIKQYLKG